MTKHKMKKHVTKGQEQTKIKKQCLKVDLNHIQRHALFKLEDINQNVLEKSGK